MSQSILFYRRTWVYLIKNLTLKVKVIYNLSLSIYIYIKLFIFYKSDQILKK